MKMATELTLYEFSVIRSREEPPHWTYTDKINVLAHDKAQAMEKFLNAHPDLYNFSITDWHPVHVM